MGADAITDPAEALPEIRLANLLELPGGRTVEWEPVGTGDPLLWIEGGPGFPAHLARPDVALDLRAPKRDWQSRLAVEAPPKRPIRPGFDPSSPQARLAVASGRRSALKRPGFDPQSP